jgi:hypothetical protein
MSGRILSVVLAGALVVGVASGAPSAMAAGKAREAHLTARLHVDPDSGPAGTVVGVKGEGFAGVLCSRVSISFTDANGASTGLGLVHGARFKTTVTIPTNAAIGAGSVNADGWHIDPFHHCVPGGSHASATFTVTARQAPLVGSIRLQPTSGLAGTVVRVKGRGFQEFPCSMVSIYFTDANGVTTFLTFTSAPSFKTRVTIPTSAAIGAGLVTAKQWYRDVFHRCEPIGPTASATFTVTP